MLAPSPQHDLRDRGGLGLREHIGEEMVRLLAALLGLDEIRRGKINRVDFRELDEAGDIH